MIRITCFALAMFSWFVVLAAAPAMVAAAKPNLVFINIDDLGYADIGPFGSERNRTPHLDRMAAEGRKLTCFYAAPVCSPSRASLMTGSYPKRALPIPHVLFPGNDVGLSPNEVTVAELLKGAGYVTGCIGKWHLGDQPEFLPTRHGFDYYFGLPYSNDMGPAADGVKSNLGAPLPPTKGKGQPPLPLMRNETVLQRVLAEDQTQLVARYAEEAITFLREHKDEPFFLYLPHSAVHFPIYPGKAFQGKSPHGYYSDWVEEVDWGVGQVLDTIRELGLSENTLVMFTSDNGGTRRGVNLPLRGHKGSTWEGGVRVPTIAWWPGQIPPNTSTNEITGMFDILPTFAKLGGASLPADRRLDGADIWPLLAGHPDAKPVHDGFLYYRGLKLEAVRSGAWKLRLANRQLYNLDHDLGESKNVARENPQVVQRLEVLASATQQDLGPKGLGPGCRPLGRVSDARPLIDHDGQIRPGFAERTEARPNLIVILADDMGYGDVGALNPDSKIPTPNLDRLAAEGVSFTDAHSPSAVCTPTRYGLLTGRYCWRGRLKSGVLNGYSPRLIEPGRQTIATLLRSAGYHTGIVGKWHLGLGWARATEAAVERRAAPRRQGTVRLDLTKSVADTPNELGFDYSYIIPASLDFPPYVYVHNDRVTDPTTTEQARQSFPAYLRNGPRSNALIMDEALDHLTEKAVSFIGERSGGTQPFFLYFPLTAPHKPVLPHERFRGKSGLGAYGDFVVQVDWTVGRILEAVDDASIAENTLVLFTSDNGSYMHRLEAATEPDHVDDASIQAFRADRHRANGRLRGTKADVWEAGHRVPFLVRWPPAIPAGVRRDETVCLTDVMATCAQITHATIAPEAAEDSYSLLPLLRGQVDDWARPPVINHSAGGMFAIREGKWKLVAGDGSGGREVPKGKPFRGPYQLFDLSADIGERVNVFDEYPEVAQRLEAALEAIRAEGRSVD